MKLEPLSSILRKVFQQYCVSDTKVSAEEMTIGFFGRTKHSVEINTKLIKQGYKVWAFSYKGYTSSFLSHSDVNEIGKAEIHPVSELTPTTAVVYQLARTLF